LQDRSKWKATEWLSWTLYYSFPCMKDILNNDILESFLLFVHSLFKLLQNNISKESLKQCHINLYQFVGENQLFYGNASVTFNIHSILHLCELMRRSGPLWAISVFPYESNIYNLKKLMKNLKNVDLQIVENFIKKANYHYFLSNFEASNLCSNFCTLI